MTFAPQIAARILRALKTRSTHEVARELGVSQSALAAWARAHAPWIAKRTGGARLQERRRKTT